MNCWGPAFTAAIIVGLVLVIGFIIFVFAMINYVKSYISKVALKLINLSTALFKYFNALLVYLRDPVSNTIEALQKEIDNVVSILADYINLNDKRKQELVNIFKDKTTEYLENKKEELYKNNQKLENILGVTKLESTLNQVDNYILSKPENSSMLYRVLENLEILLSR